MLTKVFERLRNLRLIEKLLMQGIILGVVLIIVQAWLDSMRNAFMSYMAPLGFVFFMLVTYMIQPIAVGALNIFIINRLYGTKGWQVGFWLNGVFLVLAFSTINIVMQISLNLSFTYIAVIDIVALSIPFGCIARFSNGGWKKPID